MTDPSPVKSIRGYVSAYLERPLRTIEEAESDSETAERGPSMKGAKAVDRPQRNRP